MMKTPTKIQVATMWKVVSKTNQKQNQKLLVGALENRMMIVQHKDQHHLHARDTVLIEVIIGEGQMVGI